MESDHCDIHSSDEDVTLRALLPNVDLEAGLQALENAGIVGSANRMSIAELLNPQDENPEPVVATAEQWFESQNQMEVEAAEMEVYDPVIPPTASEALKAVSLLIQFIESTDIPEATIVDPLLPALESTLTSKTCFAQKNQPSITSFLSIN